METPRRPQAIRGTRATATGATGRRSALRRPGEREEGVWNSDSDPDLPRSEDDAPLISRPVHRQTRAQAARASRAPQASRASQAASKKVASKKAAKKAVTKPVTQTAPPKAEKTPRQEDWGPWLPSNRSAAWKNLQKTLLPSRPKRTMEDVPKHSKKPKAKAKAKTMPAEAKESQDAEMAELFGEDGEESKEPRSAPSAKAPKSRATAPAAKTKDGWWALPDVPEEPIETPVEERPEGSPPEHRPEEPDVPKVQPADLTPQMAITPMLGQADESKSVLVCGDLNGEIKLLQKTLLDLKENGTKIDLVFAVGRFCPEASAYEDFRSQCQETELAAPVYFIDSAAEDLIDAAQKNSEIISFGKDISFLGAYGIREIEGLTVAFLSGKYTDKSYRKISENFFGQLGTGEGHLYTENTVKEMKLQAEDLNIDVLLTCEWPETFWSTAKKSEATNPVDSCFRSPAVRDLFFELKPRYHVYASANMYRLRKAQQGPYGFVATSVALCEAFTDSDAEADSDVNQKWFHNMSMRHNCPEKYTLVNEAGHLKVKSQTKLSHL